MEVVEQSVLDAVFTGDRDEPWNPTEKLPLIVDTIERLKLDLKAYLSKHGTVKELTDESEALCAEGNNLTQELNDLEHEIESETMAEIIRLIKDHDAVVLELEKVNYSINIVYDAVHCGKYLKDFEEYRREEKFRAATERLTDITEFLTTPAEGFSDLTMYGALKTSVEYHWEEVLTELNRRWNRMLNWEFHDESDTTYVVTLDMTMCDIQSHVDVLLALDLCKLLKPKISEFARFLLEQILVAIVKYDCTFIEECSEEIIMHANRVGEKPKFNKVNTMLRSVFNILSERLNLEVQKGDTVMTLVGKEVGVEFAEVLVKDCLVNTVPSSLSELKSYGLLTAEAESLQCYLIEMGFFPKDVSIMYYINDLESLFANKISQHFLGSARSIMLRDLSDSMSIGVESVPVLTETPVLLDPQVEEALSILDKTLPKSLFYFPRCMISRSTQDLLNEVLSMMEQAWECSDHVAKRLYTTARLIFELYEAVVPYHHENYLLTIPQYVALFHNNCMYLAHNLLTLGEKWVMKEGESGEVNYPLSFVDLVPKMRDLAYKHITMHLQQQRKQILDNIRSSDLNCIVVKDVLDDNAEQAIRQCLRQLQLLKNVWIGVFPSNVFRRLMSCLVNSFVEEIIHRVCTVEDISAEMATQLTDIYTIVLKRTPNLFHEHTDLSQTVKSWVKLEELIFILGGSLKDIEKRWSDGTGPLAIHFRVEELRNLIKALFQNTQFRANLLAKIK